MLYPTRWYNGVAIPYVFVVFGFAFVGFLFVLWQVLSDDHEGRGHRCHGNGAGGGDSVRRGESISDVETRRVRETAPL